MAHPAPVAAGERLETLDVLRGFAVLGILAMNIRAMAAPFSVYMYPYALWDYSGLNRVAYLVTSVVFDLKMMGLFSMLFGVGVLLYAAKPTETGRPPRGLWFRRMSWLLVIGLVHGYFIWGGDILVPYALCGIVLLWWARRLPAWVLTVGAVAFLLIGALIGLAHGLLWEQMDEATRAEQAAFKMPNRAQVEEQLAPMLGSYWETLSDRGLFVFMAETVFFLMFFLWRCGGMMMLGMALYKWGFLDGRRSSRAYALTTAFCIPAGLLLSWQGARALEAIRYAMPERMLADTWNYAGSILASVGYAALLILLIKVGAAGALRRALAAVGRMAFTNYLMQSILTAVLFLGAGFGLAGKLDYAEQLIVVGAIWTAELIWSPLWLSRFRFGPFEWVWRSLTYWELQPMRAAPASGAAA